MQEKIRADLKRFISKQTSRRPSSCRLIWRYKPGGHTDASNYPGHARPVFTPETRLGSRRDFAARISEKIPSRFAAPSRSDGWRIALRRWAVSLARLTQARVGEERATVVRESCFAKSNPRRLPPASSTRPIPLRTLLPIGGNIAVNSAAPAAFRYGATRRHVLSLRVAFMDGSHRNVSPRREDRLRGPADLSPRTTKSRRLSARPAWSG